MALPGDSFTALFSESAARALVSVVPGREREFAALAEEHGVPATVLGVTAGDTLTVEGTFEVPLAELRAGLDGHPAGYLRLAAMRRHTVHSMITKISHRIRCLIFVEGKPS